VESEIQETVRRAEWRKQDAANIQKWMIANPEEGLAICREFFVQVPLKIVVGPPAAAKAENEMVDTTGELVIPMKMPSTEMSVRNYLSSNAARGRRIVVDFVRRTLSGAAASLLDAQFEAKLDAIAPPDRIEIGRGTAVGKDHGCEVSSALHYWRLYAALEDAAADELTTAVKPAPVEPEETEHDRMMRFFKGS
jgi:hypothetical protein